jgi:hypothetical protein
MDIDTNNLVASFFFGLVGLGMFMYGKKAGRMIPLGAGLALMVVPYFLSNLAVLIVVGCVLMGVPWVVREG